MAANVADHRSGFFGLVFQLQNPRAGPGGPSGLKLFFVTISIESDQRIGHPQNFGAAAVVFFQVDDLRIGPVQFETQNMFHFRAPPAVNRLIVVAHHTQIAMTARQGFHHAILAGVRILVLVHQHVIESIGLGPANRSKPVQQFLSQQ